MAATYREDRAWWWVDFVFVFPDGRKKRIREPSNVNTRAGAEKYERDRRVQLAANDGAAPSPLFEDFVRDSFLPYAANNTKRSTHYETELVLLNHLGSFFKGMRLEEITEEQIEAYKLAKKAPGASARYSRDLSKKTINNHLLILSRILHWAHSCKHPGTRTPLLPLLPRIRRFDDVRPQDKAFTFLDFQESPRFIAAAEKQGAPWDTLVPFAIHTGLRIGELRGLDWTDVDFVAAKVTVRRRMWQNDVDTTKSNKSRTIPLSATARAALVEQRYRTGLSPVGRVFGEMTYSVCRYAFGVMSRRAGLGKVIRPHDLRHTFASQLTMRGVPLKTIQELLGHADITMTLRYSHLAQEAVQHAVSLLDGAPPPVAGRSAGPGDTHDGVP
jgi:integrase